jgi:hypothetical protein
MNQNVYTYVYLYRLYVSISIISIYERMLRLTLLLKFYEIVHIYRAELGYKQIKHYLRPAKKFDP